VAGKGVPAALFMALSRTVIRTTALAGRGPASVLMRANRLIQQDSQAEMLLTAVYAVLEVQTGCLIYANGGHSRPLWYRAAAGRAAELVGRGIVLGAFESIELEECRIDLARGDVLVLYTDGITEAVNPDGEMFGEERLATVVAASAGGGADETLHAIVAALRDFTGDHEPADDVACVVVRRS